MMKQIRKQLLKIAKARKDKQQEQRDDLLFAKCMIASGTIREPREPRVVRGYIDSENWGKL